MEAEKLKDMTEGKPLFLIISLAFPLMLGNIFQQLYTVVDTMVVGKVLGVNALAALGAADWLNWMMLGVITGFTQGFSIHIAQEFGSKNIEGLKETVGVSAKLAFGIAIFLLIGSQIGAKFILHIMNTPDDIFEGAFLYLQIMFAGIPIIMAFNFFASILRALGDGKTPLYAMIVASFVNIGLDILFVMVFHWGIRGAAFATITAQLCASIYCFFALRKIPILKLEKRHWNMQQDLSRKLLGLGFPMALQNTLIAIGGLVVQFVVNGFGVIFIAGFTATNKLYGILEVASTSYGYAMTTYVGQNLGAGKKGRIKQGMKAAVFVAILTSFVISAIMLLFGRSIVGLFISGTPEEVQEAIEIAYHYLTIMSWFLSILYLLFIYRAALQGLGNTIVPMLSGFAEFFMRIVTALWLSKLMGQNGIFYAEVSAWIGATVILVTAYYGFFYKNFLDNNIGKK